MPAAPGHPLHWRNLLTPALLAVAALALRLLPLPAALHLTVAQSGLAAEDLPALLGTAAAAALAIRLAQFAIARHLGAPPPRLMRQITALLIWTLTAIILAGSLFHVPLGSLVTTSGLMVAVVGFALKNMISDLATGLSLPVKVGDWIEVGDDVGRVLEVNWRATRLLTTSEVVVVIPNTHLMAQPFRNFSLPDSRYQDSISITLPADLPVEQAERLLLGAARQQEAIARQPQPPDLQIRAFTEQGITWQLRFHVPDAGQAERLRYRVTATLLRNLRLAGISVPTRPLQTAGPAAAAGDRAFLAALDLFDGLDGGELAQLGAQLIRHPLAAGETVVHQGQPGDSLFILKEGLLRVSITGADGRETVVGQIQPGQVFGEMSLLTGEPRSATVTASLSSLALELDRPALAPLLHSRPDLVRHLGQVLANRQLRNAPKLETTRPADDEPRQSLVLQWIGRINAFFSLETG